MLSGLRNITSNQQWMVAFSLRTTVSHQLRILRKCKPLPTEQKVVPLLFLSAQNSHKVFPRIELVDKNRALSNPTGNDLIYWRSWQFSLEIHRENRPFGPSSLRQWMPKGPFPCCMILSTAQTVANVQPISSGLIKAHTKTKCL